LSAQWQTTSPAPVRLLGLRKRAACGGRTGRIPITRRFRCPLGQGRWPAIMTSMLRCS